MIDDFRYEFDTLQIIYCSYVNIMWVQSLLRPINFLKYLLFSNSLNYLPFSWKLGRAKCFRLEIFFQKKDCFHRFNNITAKHHCQPWNNDISLVYYG